jgi:uncharacterized coiled-coil protein SlyX
MSDVSLPPPRRNGNGNGYPAPTSRKAFLRSAPARIGLVEDRVEVHEHRVDAIAACVSETYERIDNLTKAIARLTERLDRIDRRSARSRRKLAVVVDQVADSLA